ncbi:MAG: hypothetical protein U0Y82_15185 [Thermoleophilia bacterium]
MSRLLVRCAILVVAVAAVVGGAFILVNAGVIGSGHRDGGPGFPPPATSGAVFRPPDGDHHDGGFGRGRNSGQWFSAEGIGGFAPVVGPLVLALGGVILLDSRRRRRSAKARAA